MSSLDLELDGRMDDLEFEWRQAREASTIARAEYLALGADLKRYAGALDSARERLRRAEAIESRVLAKIEFVEDNTLGLS